MSKSDQERRISDEKYKAGQEIERTSKVYTRALVPHAPPALKILDIGCGSGLNSKHMRDKGHDVTGVDLSPVAIEKYNAAGMRGVVHDISEGLPFEADAFDLVFASEVIEHLADTEKFLEAIHKVLKPDGQLVLSTPNSAFWVYRLYTLGGATLTDIQHPGHVRFFSKKSLRRYLAKAGFDIRTFGGRNMYLILPAVIGAPLARLFGSFGFHKEIRFKTKKEFAHFSHYTDSANGFFTDTLIVSAIKQPLISQSAGAQPISSPAKSNKNNETLTNAAEKQSAA